MTRGGSQRTTERVFVAVSPSWFVREGLAGWARQAELGTGARRLAPKGIHLTLCFLDQRDRAEVAATEEAMHGAARPLGRLETGAPVWLPRRRPRALAVEVHDPGETLARLQAELAAGLAEAIGWQPPRSFRPHVTVARFGPGAKPRRDRLPPTPALGFQPEAVILYRSLLHAGGAEYEAIAEVALSAK